MLNPYVDKNASVRADARAEAAGSDHMDLFFALFAVQMAYNYPLNLSEEERGQTKRMFR